MFDLFDHDAPCQRRLYHSPWSIDDCMAFLGRRNIYDSMRYSFKTNIGESYIHFYALERILNPYLNSKYRIVFEQKENGTSILIEHVETRMDCNLIPGHQLSYNMLDEFFQHKIDAVPTGR